MTTAPHASLLAELLQEVGAKPTLRLNRVAGSTLYDLEYRVSVIACVFALNGTVLTTGDRELPSHWLKLLQFVAVRPNLLPPFQSWAKGRRNGNVDIWQEMPRGYLGDGVHDRAVELLVASRQLVRTPETLVVPSSRPYLRDLYVSIAAAELLASERKTLETLADYSPNKTMLRGE